MSNFIALKANGKFLDLGNVRLGVQYDNPIFYRNKIPGIITYPFDVPAESKVNRSLFKHPQVSSSTAFVDSIDNVELYIYGVLWKIGKLNLLSGNSKVYQLNFQSDSGDLSEGIKQLKLYEIDLGAEVLDYGVTAATYPTYNYALFTVRWDNFYGDTNPDYLGYVNYYDSSFLTNSGAASEHAIVPFPYLHYLLKKVFDHFGYVLKGDILTDANFNKLVVMNNRALDKVQGSINVFDTAIDFTKHVPDITIGNFITAVKAKAGIDFIFNATRKEVTLVRVKDVLNDTTFLEMTKKASPDPGFGVNDYDGITFSDQFDSNDSLSESRDIKWTEYRIGNGEGKIESNLSSMLLFNGTDPIDGGRTIEVPWVDSAGSSPEFGLGENDIGLRLMYYNGIVGGIPTGSYKTSTESLRWEDGAIGAAAVHYSEWVDFKSYTRSENFTMTFGINDLLNINPVRKWQINYQRYLWSKIRISIDNKVGIKSTKVNGFRVRR